MSVCKTGKTWIMLVDCVNINLLFMILYYRYAWICQWGKLSKECMWSIIHEAIWTVLTESTQWVVALHLPMSALVYFSYGRLSTLPSDMHLYRGGQWVFVHVQVMEESDFCSKNLWIQNPSELFVLVSCFPSFASLHDIYILSCIGINWKGLDFLWS